MPTVHPCGPAVRWPYVPVCHCSHSPVRPGPECRVCPVLLASPHYHLWNLALLGLAQGGAGLSHVSACPPLGLGSACGCLCYVAVCTSWGQLHPCSLPLPVFPFHPKRFFRWGHTGDGLLPIQCLLLGCHLPLLILCLPRGLATCRSQVETGDSLQVLGPS